MNKIIKRKQDENKDKVLWQHMILHVYLSVFILQLLNPLFEYLTQNLTTLGNNLLPSVFQRYSMMSLVSIYLLYFLVHHIHILTCSITETLWEVSVGAVEQLSRIPRKKDLLVQQRLLDTLNSLRDFYYCEGDGVSGRALDSDAYLVRYKKKLLPQSLLFGVKIGRRERAVHTQRTIIFPSMHRLCVPS